MTRKVEFFYYKYIAMVDTAKMSKDLAISTPFTGTLSEPNGKRRFDYQFYR
jgi:hypothetical protein